MKTIVEVAKRTGISKRLIRSTLRQLGGGKKAVESLRDVLQGRADAGFCGFTYYRDTISFFKQNRSDIIALVESMARDLGEEAIAMVCGFNCLRYDTPEEKKSVAKCLYGGRLTDDDVQTANALAWFALEEVARAYHDE